MADYTKLRSCLSEAGILSEEDLARAESRSEQENEPLDASIMELGLMECEDVGNLMSTAYELPYLPLREKTPAQPARHLMSAECAQAWRVVPMDYEPGDNVLTLAIGDPDRAPVLERIYAILMQPYTLAFTIAPAREIDRVLDEHFAVAQETAEEEPVEIDDRPKKAKLSIPEPAERDEGDPGAAAAEEETVDLAGSSPVATETSTESPYSYSDMAEALTQAVSIAVRARLGEGTEYEEAATGARYCVLLASRLGFTSQETDAIAVSAWIDALGDDEMAGELATPYDVETIIGQKSDTGEPERREAQVLKLVKCYQVLNREDPGTARDVNLTRRHLHAVWSSSPEVGGMLETFLQILMDEQFLSKLDQAAGTVLLVDSDENAASSLRIALAKDGYKVDLAMDEAAARETISSSPPDLVVAAMSLKGGSGLTLCRELKNAPVTSGIPVILVGAKGEDSRAAESLRAGADEFLTKPVDLEILFLKVGRLLVSIPEAKAPDGVSGSLSDMGFSDMIQILCAGGKSMEISFDRAGETGQVCIELGNIVHAEVGAAEGEDAFYQLMRWQAGDFTARECESFEKRTVMAPVMSLLMEGARLADESAEAEA